MQNSFYNTTGEIGEKLKEFESKCKGQELIVLKFFQEKKYTLFSPVDVLDNCFSENTPITSVRRAITNLTKAGFLIKTDKKVKGMYGKDNYLWKFNAESEQNNLFKQ